MDDESREQSRDLALRGTERSPLTKRKRWKSGAKRDNSGRSDASECQKQRDFQGGLDLMRKGGGGRGGSKMQKPWETMRFKVVKTDRFGARFRAKWDEFQARFGLHSHPIRTRKRSKPTTSDSEQALSSLVSPAHFG